MWNRSQEVLSFHKKKGLVKPKSRTHNSYESINVMRTYAKPAAPYEDEMQNARPLETNLEKLISHLPFSEGQLTLDISYMGVSDENS